MTRTRLNRESFQNLLAGAFSVQQTLLDVQSPSLIHALRHLVVTRQLGLEMAVRLIAGCARNVANANGVTIGLLESNQLAYVAGSGSRAACIGRRVSAALSVATNTKDGVEILRVENAELETRIEAAICRQFGAKALLILPVYRGRALAGVIEIIFSEAHVFHDREVCTYRLMADLVEEALAHSGTSGQKAEKSTPLTTDPERMKQRVLYDEKLPGNSKSLPNMGSSYTARGAGTEPEKLVSGQGRSVGPNRPLERPSKLPTSHLLWWRFADPAAVIIVLVAAAWIAYGSGRSATSFTNSAQQIQDAHPHHELLSARSQVIETSREQPETAPTEAVTRSGTRTPRRVMIGNQEIDYVSEDVTVRHFLPRVAAKPKEPVDRRAK